VFGGESTSKRVWQAPEKGRLTLASIDSANAKGAIPTKALSASKIVIV